MAQAKLEYYGLFIKKNQFAAQLPISVLSVKKAGLPRFDSHALFAINGGEFAGHGMNHTGNLWLFYSPRLGCL